MIEKVEKIKEIIEGIFKPFKDAWDTQGAPVIQSAQLLMQSLKDTILDIGKTWYAVWTSGTGTAYIVSILNLVRSVLNIVRTLSDAFRAAWNDNGNGYKLIESYYKTLSNVHDLLAAIGDTFSRVFSYGTGAAILSNIFQIVTGINNIFGNIAERILIAWNTAGAGAGIWQGILDIVNNVLTFINTIITATANWASHLNFSPLLLSISGLLQQIAPLVQTIGNFLSSIYTSVLLPVSTFLIQTAIPGIINAATAFFNFLNEHQWIVEAIGTALVTAFSVSKVGGLINKISSIILKLIKVISGGGGLLGGIQTVVSVMGGPLTAVIAAVIAAGVLLITHWDQVRDAALKLKDWVVQKTQGLKDGVVKAWNTLKGNIGDAVKAISTSVQEKFEAIKTWVIDKATNIKDKVSEIFENLSTVSSEIWNGIKTTISTIWNGLKSTATTIFNNIKTAVTTVWNTLRSKTSSIWNGIKSTLSTAWNNLKSTATSRFNSIKTLITNAWNSLRTFTTSSWSNIKTVISQRTSEMLSIAKGVTSGIRSAFDSAFSGIYSAASSILSKVGTLLANVWDRVRSTASSVASAIGNMVSGRRVSAEFPIPVTPVPNMASISNVKIPYLAKGAVIPPNAPFMAILGDQKHGTNIEAPLDEVEKSVSNALRQNGTGSGLQNVTIRIPVILDGRQIFESVINEAKMKQLVSGRNPFEMG